MFQLTHRARDVVRLVAWRVQQSLNRIQVKLNDEGDWICVQSTLVHFDSNGKYRPKHSKCIIMSLLLLCCRIRRNWMNHTNHIWVGVCEWNTIFHNRDAFKRNDYMWSDCFHVATMHGKFGMVLTAACTRRYPNQNNNIVYIVYICGTGGKCLTLYRIESKITCKQQ